MKKTFAFVLCALMAASLAACQGSDTADKETVSNAETSAETTGKDENLRPANPFVTCQTIEEAADRAGFSLTAPESREGYSEKQIQAIEGEMIQIRYLSGEDEILIRKAAAEGDISGDYTNYTVQKTVSADEKEVVLKGNDETMHLAVWSDGEFSFSAWVKGGMEEEQLLELVKNVR
jgi:hypothetical protein